MPHTVEEESILNEYYKKCIDVEEVTQLGNTRSAAPGHQFTHVVEESKDPETIAVDEQLSSLRAMRASLIQSIYAMENAIATLGDDSTTIRQLSERFHKYGVVMSVGSGLVREYNSRIDRQQGKIRLLFILLCTLAVYIVFRRLLWTFLGVALPGL